jgi:hypothetical protein
LHDLIPLVPALPALGALTDATMAYAEAEKALATRQAYAADWSNRSGAAAAEGPATRGALTLAAPRLVVASPLAGW